MEEWSRERARERERVRECGVSRNRVVCNGYATRQQDIAVAGMEEWR
jgi:hypothetical protein